MDNNFDISIIINTKNEELNLPPLLRSISNQTFKNYEIILVDNKSEDRTLDVAKNFTDRIFTKGPERSVQKNYGAKLAKGKFLLFLDADMTIENNVIEECVALVSTDKDVKAIIIHELSFGQSFWAKCKALERNCYIGDDTIEAPRFFERETYLSLGGYNEGMISGEDWDLAKRVRKSGYKIGRIQSYIHHNEGHLSLVKSIKKKYYYAKNATPYVDSNVSGPKDILLFIFRPAYFRNWKLLIKDPIHASGFIFMKFLEIGAGAIPIISKKLGNKK